MLSRSGSASVAETIVSGFSQWFAESKVVDKKGRPLVVYHGTAREDPDFRPARGGGLGGIYFAPSAEEANQHAEMDSEIDGGAPFVIPVYLSIKNPKVFTDSIDSQQFTIEQMQEWERQGFDGVIGRSGDGTVVEIAAFRLEQIKSAIGSSGEARVERPDIRLSVPSALPRNFFRALPDLGFARLGELDERTYRDAGGSSHLTFEREGVRISLSSNSELYEDRGAVMVGEGNPEDCVLRALIVDPELRGQGLARQAMSDLMGLADEYGKNLHLEVAPLEGSPLDCSDLADFYGRCGFKGLARVMVRPAGSEVPESRPAERCRG